MTSKILRFLARVGLLALVTLAAVMAYNWVVEPWYHNWGATQEEILATLPGDERVPGAAYEATRGVTINAPPEAIWPWLAQMGQGRGGLYSYEFLENLIGCDLHNADIIHPEWQSLKVGDPVRFLPADYLGMSDTPHFTAGLIEPSHVLALDPWATFILQPVDANSTRLIARSRAASADPVADPLTFVMQRRMMLGIKERAEGNIQPSIFDTIEVLTWMIAFGLSVVAGIRVLMGKSLAISLGLLCASIAIFFILMFARPPLMLSLLLVFLLAASFWVALRGLPGRRRAHTLGHQYVRPT